MDSRNREDLGSNKVMVEMLVLLLLAELVPILNFEYFAKDWAKDVAE